MDERAYDYSLVVGGQAGQGMQTLGLLLVKGFLAQGHFLTTLQSFHSRIRGGHNYYQIRLASAPVHSVSRPIDILVALNAQTLELHQGELTPNGAVIYDSGKLAAPDLPQARLGLPLTEIYPEVATLEVLANSVYLGALAALFGLEPGPMLAPLERTLAGKAPEILAQNAKAFHAGYGYVQDRPEWRGRYPAPPPANPGAYSTANGNEAVALGAIAADCRFYSAYPMTPASSVLETLAEHGSAAGMVVEQAEDEIAALNMVLGASYAGARAMTGTAGGGFALMVEALSLSGMLETPAVVLVGMRPGPATGLPTRTEQGDLAFVVHAGHGEFARAVLAPGDAEQCFRLTAHAFNLADRYQTPALILTDQYLADLCGNAPRFEAGTVTIDRGKVCAAAGEYQRYAWAEDGISPRALPGSGPGTVVVDSDEHTPDGHLTEDLEVRARMVEKRLRKTSGLLAEFIAPTLDGDARENLVICWGSNLGVCQDAVAELRRRGRRVSLAHFSQVWPLPGERLRELLTGYGHRILVENNATGQFARLLRGETSVACERLVLKYDGRPFYLDELTARLDAELA